MGNPLHEIRDSFLRATDWGLALAQSLFALLKSGETTVAEHVTKYPDADFFIGVGHPDTATIVSPPIRLASALAMYRARQSAVAEMVHGQLIQHWHDFLEKLYARMVRDHVKGAVPHPKLGTIVIRLDFGEDDSGNLANNLADRAIRQFDFADATSKLRIVARALEADVPEELSNAIKKHVAVRNVLQHNDGILRDEDLRFLGLEGSAVSLLNNKAEPALYSSGDRLVLTFWELAQVREDLQRAARLLVP